MDVVRRARDGLRRVVLVGDVAPPWGGVTAHLDRLQARLVHAGLAVWRVPPCRTLPVARWYARLVEVLGPGDVVHGHIGGPWNVAGMAAVHFGAAPVVWTVHSERLPQALGNLPRPLGWGLARALGTSARVVPVTEPIAARLVDLGVPSERIEVLPAFLPPPGAARGGSAAPLPAPAEALAQRASPLLVVMASNLTHAEGGAVYGLDLAVEALALLRRRMPNAGLVAYVSSQAGAPPGGGLHAFEDLAEQLGVGSHVAWVTGEHPLWPALARADVFVRPTRFDGDPLSVREALALGTPVVASDVAPRPPGVVCHRASDAADLARAIECAVHTATQRLPQADPFERLLAIYAMAVRRGPGP